jgi:hypothetical protein
MRTANHPVLVAIRRKPAILARFWSHVDRSGDRDACWEWQGRRDRAGCPAFNVGQTRIAPARLAWLWSTGELPRGGRLHRRCQNALCVRPSHLEWIVGAVTERRLAAESDGYVAVSGVKVLVRDPPCRWPRAVRVAATSSEGESAPDLPRRVLTRPVNGPADLQAEA